MGKGMRVARAICVVWMSAAVTVGAACVEVSDVGDASRADVDARLLEQNGLELNGFRLNGFRLNGFRLNGFRLNGDELSQFIELISIELPGGGSAASSWLDGSNLHVETSGGQVLSGAQLVGAELRFEVADGGVGLHRFPKVKIVGVTPLSTDPEVLLYDLQIKDKPGPWEPLCVDGLGAPTAAIMIGEAWNPATGTRIAPRPEGVVTLACRGAALAKCVEWGYHPWEYADYHQACTRAVRADYCGDGVPHTIQGVLIHVLDDLGIQVAEPNTEYEVEAEWGPGGAICVNGESRRLPEVPLECERPSCGEPFASGGVIQTGVPTN